MTLKYLRDYKGNIINVQMPLQDYYRLLKQANELPDYVKAGFRRGQE